MFKKTIRTVQEVATGLTQRQQAAAIIHTATIAAAGVGASPVPFADEVVIVPAQVGMITALYKLYGKEINAGFARGMSSATMATTFAHLTLGNFMKILPGVGTITGGIINASFAATVTETMVWKLVERLEKGAEVQQEDLNQAVKIALRLFAKAKNK
ncbi:GTPase [Weissella soli]|uniref:GTPase n=1 Tax=Weissella soli TaxID=155866 RepID=UPI0035A00788